MGKRQNQIWDKGLDYYEFIHWLMDQIVSRYPPEGKNEEKQFVYYSILAIQVANGLRISEAIEAFKKWVKTGERIITVRVRKKRENSKDENKTRPVRIPNILRDDWRWVYEEYVEIDNEKLRRRIISWASKHYHNTHSVRYAWITHMLIEGVNPALVAQAVRHSKLDMVLRYTQRLKADQLIMNEDW